MKLDRNCDLGEAEPRRHTQALMRWITSANVACGGHAGDVDSMRTCVRLAVRHGVRVGAHPGLPARESFGRGPVDLAADDLELLLLQQVSALERIARAEGARLHHVKLHGSLYHATDRSHGLARAYLRAMRRWWPGCVIFARAGGLVARMGPRSRVRIWEEGFADRAYRADGTLVPRGEPGAILASCRAVLEQVRRLRESGEVRSVTGAIVRLRVRTVCVHSDTPGAVQLARALAAGQE